MNKKTHGIKVAFEEDARQMTILSENQSENESPLNEHQADRSAETQRAFLRSATPAIGRDAIIIRLSPSVYGTVTKYGYQLSNPLISVHSIYVRLSRPTDRRGGITISRCEKARARARADGIVNAHHGISGPRGCIPRARLSSP